MDTQTTTPVAPTPSKSRRRWYLLGGVALMLAAPVGYYFFAGWWSDRQMAELERSIDEEDPNWRWPDVLADVKPVPDERNSALQVARIKMLLPQNDPLARGGKWDDLPWEYPNARLANVYADPLRTAFGAYRKETLAEMRKLKDMPEGHYALKLDDNPFAVKLEYVQDTRIMLSRLQYDAVLRSQEGDHEGAAESCMAMVNIPGSLRNQPFLIGQLVRVAEQSIATTTIERTLAQGKVSEPTLAKLQALLEAEADSDGFHRAMRGERASAHQTYLNLRSGKTTFAELQGLSGLKMGISEKLLDAFPGVILKDYPNFLRLMNEQVRAGKLKDTERTTAMAKIDLDVKSNRTNLLIRLIMPATTKVSAACTRSQAWMRCAIVGVAAERFRLEHNAWPRSQEELVKAKLLKEVHHDPYDGQPLRLKRTPNGFIVYSIGVDMVDNGGVQNRKSRIAPGNDWGFELWDPNLRGVPPVAEQEK